jgi:hypothetical protein
LRFIRLGDHGDGRESRRTIVDGDLTPENFATIERIAAFIWRRASTSRFARILRH